MKEWEKVKNPGSVGANIFWVLFLTLSNGEGVYVLNGFRCLERNIWLTLRMISEDKEKVSLWKMFDLTSFESFNWKHFCLNSSLALPNNSLG